MSTSKSIGSRFAKWKLVERVSGSIRNKLLLTMLVAALVPLIAVSVVINSFASSSLMEQTFDRMTAVRTIKQQQLNNYLATIKGQAATFAEGRMIVEAMQDFRTSFTKSRGENETTRGEIDRMRDELKNYYSSQFGGEFEKRNPGKGKGRKSCATSRCSTTTRSSTNTTSSKPTSTSWARRTNCCDRRRVSTSPSTANSTPSITR